VTPTPLSRSRSPSHFTQHGLNVSNNCSGEHVGSTGMLWQFSAHRGRSQVGAYRGGRLPTACCLYLLSLKLHLGNNYMLFISACFLMSLQSMGYHKSSKLYWEVHRGASTIAPTHMMLYKVFFRRSIAGLTLHAGSGTVRIDLLHFLSEWHTRRLKQAISV